MQKKQILVRSLSLLLLLCMLAGCSPVPAPSASQSPESEPVVAPGTPEDSAPADEAQPGEAPAVEETPAGTETGESSFAPVPELIQLSGGAFPADQEERFVRHMNQVFGDHACHVLNVRAEGAAIVF